MGEQDRRIRSFQEPWSLGVVCPVRVRGESEDTREIPYVQMTRTDEFI